MQFYADTDPGLRAVLAFQAWALLLVYLLF